MTYQSHDGSLSVKEGNLYWQRNVPNEPHTPTRPTLVFLHAGVSDLTVWDDQVSHFASRGWSCLRYDRFGFGKSKPSAEFLATSPRLPIDHVQHVCQLIEGVIGPSAKAILIGLSMGGGTAFDAAALHPELVVGLAMVAGGPAVGQANDPQEDALFEEVEALQAAGEVQRAAELQVRIWGDGPLQPRGRMAKPLAARMLEWNLEITRREIEKIGGAALEMVQISPDLAKIKIPTAAAFGVFDETNTSTAMQYLGANIANAVAKGFSAGHMIPMEASAELNAFLQELFARVQITV